MKLLILLLASLGFTLAGAPDDDPMAAKRKEVEALEAEWRSAHAKFVAGAYARNVCAAEYAAEVKSLEGMMIKALESRRDYHGSRIAALQAQLNEMNGDQRAIPRQRAQTADELKRTRADLENQKQRRAALTDAGAIVAIDKLIVETNKAIALLERRISTLDAGLADSYVDIARLRGGLEALAARHRESSTTQVSMWRDLYKKFQVRGELMCPQVRR